MTLEIEFTDDQIEALQIRAAAEGLTLEGWFQKLAEQTAAELADVRRQKAEEAVAQILDLQQHVKPDPDGWTIREYVEHGRR